MSIRHDLFQIETERQEFKQLLAGNPNHFGNLPDSRLPSALNLVCNTKYEAISSVAYNPDFDLLAAFVELKLPCGYGTSLCGAGSKEYVRFFVDYGCGWKDAGLASFKAHDMPDEGREQKHCDRSLSYAVSLPHQPIRDHCNHPVIPRVRAILSWEVMPPSDPDWRPVWGNIAERYVQVSPKARKLIEFASDIAKPVDPGVALPDEYEYRKFSSLEVPQPPARSIDRLAKLYRRGDLGFSVEPRRFALPDLHSTLATSIFTDGGEAKSKLEAYRAIGLDWRSIVTELEQTRGDLNYEQLTGVGLDYNREWVTANFKILRPSGYLGTLCEYGSDEHISFWIDWEGNGEWSYLATVTVRVHDIATIPEEGVEYWVGVPVRLGAHRRSCKQAKVGRLRAVLSWHLPPSQVDCDAVPCWGNRLDAYFEIKPGVTLTELAAIDAIGGVGLTHIDVTGDGMTFPNAAFAETGAPADPWAVSRRCAFGGDITISAEVPEVFCRKSYQYRLMVRPVGAGGQGLPLMSSFVVTRSQALGGGTIWVSPQLGSGWVDYRHPDQNIFAVLGVWQSAALGMFERDELWEIKLQLADASGKILGDTGWLRVQLDNRSPVAEIGIGRNATSQGGSEFAQGTAVNGHFVARDPEGRFGAWALEATPRSLSPHAPVATSFISNSSATGIAPGEAWRLDTASNTAGNPLQAGAYRVALKVWDNTIVHSSQFLHNYAEDHVELCLCGNF